MNFLEGWRNAQHSGQTRHTINNAAGTVRWTKLRLVGTTSATLTPPFLGHG